MYQLKGKTVTKSSKCINVIYSHNWTMSLVHSKKQDLFCTTLQYAICFAVFKLVLFLYSSQLGVLVVYSYFDFHLRDLRAVVCPTSMIIATASCQCTILTDASPGIVNSSKLAKLMPACNKSSGTWSLRFTFLQLLTSITLHSSVVSCHQS